MTVLLAGWLSAGLAAGGAGFAARRLMEIRRAVSYAEHELRGPLAAVMLAVDFGLSNEGLDMSRLRGIRTELGRAELALGDLSRARQGLPSVTAVTEIDVPRVVEDSVAAWRPAAAASGVTLEFSGDTTCEPMLGDPVRLAQATGNLIANAIEHGGSLVNVTARRAAPGIRIAVTDDGPGLPGSVLAGRRRHSRAGRGQGLGIVAGIAVAHGGRLCAGGPEATVGESATLPPSHAGARRTGASLVLELPAAPRA